MKRSVTVILLFAFLFNAGGYYVWFSVLQYHMQRQIRHEIRQGLPDEALTCITITESHPAGISWIKPGKEFLYRGKMYDVVRIAKSGQQTHYYCINDVKEKQLIANYHRNQQQKKQASKRIKLNLKKQYFNQTSTYFHHNLLREMNFAPMVSNYHSCCSDTPSPPPKVV